MNRRTRPLLLWCFALLAMAAFARLGFWQLARSHEKSAMLERAASALDARRPQPWSTIADPRRARDYDWVEVRGRFADAPALLLDNQQHRGQVGARAYRLFVLEDGQPVLVDLGWVAVPPDRSMPNVPVESARTALLGLMMPPPGAGLSVGPPATLADGTLLATTLDPVALRETLRAPKLGPRVLRPVPEVGFGFRRDFDILPNTLPPERHVGYAVQWFALALAVLVTALLLTWRARRAAQRLRSSQP
ncbi:MAG: SURF1 family protein [Pseudomonadota bacterium]